MIIIYENYTTAFLITSVTKDSTVTDLKEYHKIR